MAAALPAAPNNTRMKTFLSISAALCAAFLLSACSNSVNTVERADPLATPDRIADKRVVTDPSLGRRVRVLGVNQGATGDLMRVQVEVENLTYSPHNFNYQFTWIDQDGFQVTSPAPTWKNAQVNGRERLFLSAIAPTPRAVDFRLNLLEP